jgi:hypothetical protein
MKTVDRIYEETKTLPETVQREVLDFVEYLAHKLQKETAGWSELSVAAALRGLEDEVWPEYRNEDMQAKAVMEPPIYSGDR